MTATGPVMTSRLDAYAELAAVGMRPREAAVTLGISYAALDRMLCRAKGDPRAVRAPAVIVRRRRRHEAILAAWQGIKRPGLTYAAAAEQIGCTRDALSSTLYRARREGVDTSSSIAYVTEEWNFLREQGVSLETAANQLGISPRTLRRAA